MARSSGKMGSNPNSSAVKLRRAVRVIRSGGVIAYPTEGVFGLGCDPDCFEAVSRILDLKRRPESAGLILIAASPEQLDGWIDPSTKEQRRLRSITRKPVTWVISADSHAPPWITGNRPTIAVRITDHPVAAALCRCAGTPLVSTSANRSGRPPARSALMVRRRFGRDVDWIVAGTVGTRSRPSEIREASTGKILRPG